MEKGKNGKSGKENRLHSPVEKEGIFSTVFLMRQVFHKDCFFLHGKSGKCQERSNL